MDKIWLDFVERLRDSDIGEVYPSFDAVPVEKKSKQRFTVIEPTQVQYGEAYPMKDGAVYPFTADFCVSTLTPMTISLVDAEAFVCQQLVPALFGTGSLMREIVIKPVEIDLKLGKMVHRCTFRIKGSLCVTKSEVQA